MERKKNIWLMCAVALLQGMVFYGSIATLYRRARGVDVFQITLIESISLLLCIAFELPWGVIADRIGYKTALVLCNGLYFLSKLVFWQATGFWWFLLERVMLSIVIAGLSGVDTSLLYLSCAPGDSQKVFGLYDSMGLLGLVAASLVYSGWIRERYALAAGLTAATYGIAALLTLFLTEVREREQRSFRLSEYTAILRELLQDPYRLLFLVGVACLTQSHQTVTVFLNQLQYERCGVSPTLMGYLYIGVTLVGVCAAFSARWTKRLGAQRTGAALPAAGCIACLVLTATRSAVWSVAGIVLLRMANSLFQPFQQEWQNRLVRSENRATELSLCAMLVDGVSAGISVLLGALASRRLWAAFLCAGAFCLAGLGLFQLWCIRTQPDHGRKAAIP